MENGRAPELSRFGRALLFVELIADSASLWLYIIITGLATAATIYLGLNYNIVPSPSNLSIRPSTLEPSEIALAIGVLSVGLACVAFKVIFGCSNSKRYPDQDAGCVATIEAAEQSPVTEKEINLHSSEQRT